jgi:hypothetical protein
MPLVFPPALQAPAVTPALVEDAAVAAAAAAPAAAAVAAPAQTADVTAPVVAAGGVKRKTVADAASALEDLLENAAQGRKLVAAKKSGKDAKVKAKAKAKAKATAATTKGKGEGSPAIIVENSRNQIKAWTGRKGENMNKIVSFKHTSPMKARKIAVDWLVSRCKELKIVVPARVK